MQLVHLVSVKAWSSFSAVHYIFEEACVLVTANGSVRIGLEASAVQRADASAQILIISAVTMA